MTSPSTARPASAAVGIAIAGQPEPQVSPYCCP
jgi:hypothetical protein